ncbi:CPBP family intramembrane glutamic endopeptidase [Salinimicrobium marinum]|uniref:CPBP family intramembrane glutamic endopeptidase n=1 Tax=Salinimicrobium marinum TaxID=680283 RepID=UPI001671CD84|nr:CPBP family intramembrane glutamic endopeptidase [Salinimicrobium marinum]
MKYIIRFILGFLFLIILLLVYVSVLWLLEFQESHFSNGYLNLTKYVEPLVLLGGVAIIYRFQKIKNPLRPVHLKIFLEGVFLTMFVEILIELTAYQFETSTKFFSLNKNYDLTLIPLYFTGIFIAALLEELFFRHYFFETIGRAIKKNEILTIIISSIFFTLMHFQYYDNYSILFSTLIFGVLYAYLLVKYKTIWLPLGVHFGHNLFDYLFGSDIINLTSNDSFLYGNFRPVFTSIEILLIIFLLQYQKNMGIRIKEA